MGLRAAGRTVVVLVVTAGVVTGYTARAASPGDSGRPQERSESGGADEGRSHRPEIGTAVKYVRNADGSVTTVRQ